MKAVDQIARSPLFSGLVRDGGDGRRETAAARKGLDDAKALLKAAGIAARDTPDRRAPGGGSGRLVEGEDFGLLVMGAYGHSRIRSFVIGSTTTEMVRSCKVPVLDGALRSFFESDAGGSKCVRA
jgi:nucleotide-binding universal stress UspA family protein